MLIALSGRSRCTEGATWNYNSHPILSRSTGSQALKIRTLLILTLNFFSLTAFSSAAWASLEVKTHFDHYDIKGRTDWELRKAMRKKGIHDQGKIFDAQTDWHVKWSYRYEADGADCRLKSLQTTLTIHYKMPRWIARDKASPELRVRWDKFYSLLLAHEEGHGNFGRKAAAEIEETLPQIGEGLQCKSFNEKANAAAQEILAKYRAEETEYDVTTRHGLTQGVYFP